MILIKYIFILLNYILLEFCYLYYTNKQYKGNFLSIQNHREVVYRFFPYAIICYIILICTYWYFVLQNIHKKSYHDIFIASTILAIAIYGVYNLTNLTTFIKNNVSLAIQDIFWGVFIFNYIGIISKSIL